MPRLGPPVVGMDADGDFAVAWSQTSDGPGGLVISDIRARRYSRGGSPSAPEFAVDTFTSGYHQAPALAMGPGGDFVVSWQGDNEMRPNDYVLVRYFDGTGAARGPEMAANLNARHRIGSADVGLAGLGSFVVVWTSLGDGEGFTILGRRFDLAPATVLPALPDAGLAALAVLGASGTFLAAWLVRRPRKAA